MKDLIDREAALNCFHSWVDQYGDVHTPDEMPEYQAIEALPSAQPEQQWIPCSEKDAEYPCLACDVFGQIFITDGGIVKINGECYDGTGFDFSNADEFLKGIKVGNAMRMLPRKIVAWLPLPEPYREEEQDG